MRIGLIDVDSHNYPNLPLMKLPAWHNEYADTFMELGCCPKCKTKLEKPLEK